VVAGLMAVAAYRLLRDSTRIFLEAAPRGIDPAAVEAAVRGLDGVTDIHELHVWEVTSGFPALSAHVLVDSVADCHERRVAIEAELHERFGIEHTTLQVDHRDEVLPPSALGRRLHPGSDHHAH
jgi:cobalt-zinc-cadmium efflux system protein